MAVKVAESWKYACQRPINIKYGVVHHVLRRQKILLMISEVILGFNYPKLVYGHFRLIFPLSDVHLPHDWETALRLGI